MTRGALIAPILFLIALAAGCGGGGDDGPSSDTSAPGSDASADPSESLAANPLDNPCGLISAEDVSGIVGEPYAVQLDGNPCKFANAEGLTLAIESTSYGGAAEDAFESALNTFGGEEMDGLGDRVFWIEGFDELHVLVDSHVIIIAAKPLDVSDKRALAVAVAEALLD